MLLSLEIYANWSRFCSRINTNFLITSHCACSSSVGGDGNVNLKDGGKKHTRARASGEGKVYDDFMRALFSFTKMLLIIILIIRERDSAVHMHFMISVHRGHISKMLSDLIESLKLANDVVFPVFVCLHLKLPIERSLIYLCDER